MARHGRDLFNRSTFLPVNPSADDILKGKVKWDEATKSWVAGGKKAARVAKPKAAKEEKKPNADVGKKLDALKYDGLTPKRVAEVRELAEKMAKQEHIPKSGSEFEEMKGERTGNNLSAYLRAKEAGILPEKGKHGTAEEILADRDKIVAFAKELETRLSSREFQEREHQLVADSQGRIIAAVKGEAGSVGIRKNNDDEAVGGKFNSTAIGVAKQIEQHAGGLQVHNHPAGDGSADKRDIGLPLSGGDFASAVQKCEAGGLAYSKEGVYVLRNTNWKRDYDEMRGRIAQIDANLSGITNPSVRETMRATYVAQVVSDVTQKAEKLGKSVDGLFYATIDALKSGGHIRREANSFREFTPREMKILARTYQNAQMKLLKQAGFEVEFIPNAGYEEIGQPLG